MAAHCHDVLMLAIRFAQAVAQPPHKGIYRLLADPHAHRVGPDRVNDIIAAANASLAGEQNLQQSILRQAQCRIQHKVH